MDQLSQIQKNFNSKPLANLSGTNDPLNLSGYSLGQNGLVPSAVKITSPVIPVVPQKAPIVPPVVAPGASAIPTPQLTQVGIPAGGTSQQQYAAPNLPNVNNQNTFSLDTSGATSDHLASDNTPDTVTAYRNQLQNNFDAFHAAQQPLQQQLYTATQFSPQELQAQQAMVNFTNSYNSGTNNILSRPEPLEFQQGQQAALNRDASLQQSALSSGLNYLENIRQNNIQAINSQIGLNQQNYQNQLGVNTTAMNFGLQNAQLGVSQQSANQGRYDYQQITDPNTGFPVIQVTDKQTGLPAGTISPSSSAGQQIMQNIAVQGGLSNTQSAAPTTNGNAVVQSTMQMMGATQDMPVSQAIQTLGLPAIVQGLIGQEGGSPQGVINNPGNIKFVGLPGQTNSGIQATDGGTFASYATPQAGQAAVGSLVQGAAQKGSSLSNFIASYKGVSNNTPQSNGMEQHYQALIQAAPVQIKNGVKQLPDGTPYIDASQIPSQFLSVANAYSAQTGVRVLAASDAKTIDDAKQSIANLSAYAALFSQLAPSNFGGKVGNALTNPVSKLLGTDYGSLLKTFQSNRDGLLQQIRTLAGSSPRLNANELNLAASALPQVGGLTSDTVKDGTNKLALTAEYLDNAIRAIDPNYIGTPVAVGSGFAIAGPDGQTYQFPDKNSALQALQLKNQMQ